MSRFDLEINRKKTDSVKFDFHKEKGFSEDLIPFWVADMDFKTCDYITNALINRVEHGIFGYTEPKDDYYEAIINWYHKRFDFKVNKNWILKSPGVVYTLAQAIKAYTNENDSVLIQTPVYYPFYNVIKNNNRIIVENELVNKGNYYVIDFNDFEDKIKKHNIKLFILCSPHNPVGRVWNKDELKSIIEICKKYNVIIISDEIHNDIVFKPNKHYMLGQIDLNFDNYIICTSITKTFNLAGIQASNVVVKNNDLKKKLINEFNKTGYSQNNTLGLLATKIAYTKSEEWLEELLDYLYKNYLYLKNYLETNSLIKVTNLEGTYLVWLDFSNYKLTDEEINNIIINEAKLWFNKGTIFGKNSLYYHRVNIATTRFQLENALKNLCRVFKNFE